MICNFVTKSPKKKSQKKEQRIKKMLTFASFKRTNDCFTDFKKAKKMKKLVFMFVAIAAISFASCNGNKTAQNTASADSDTAQVDTTAADTAAADTAAADSAK